MATIASVARDRRNALKSVMTASLKLDAKQEALEREVKRIRNRKRAVPEAEDMVRLISLADTVAQALDQMVAVIKAASDSFRMT